MTIDNPSSERGVLDDEVLEELREDMEDEFGEVVEAFLDEVPAWIETMNQAIAESNAEELFQTAHSLKSSSGYMGAPAMQQLAAQLERMGREGSVECCDAFLAELVKEYQAVEPRLRELAAG